MILRKKEPILKEKEKYIKIKLDLANDNDLLLSKIYEKISRGSKKRVVFNALIAYIRDKSDDNLIDIFNANSSDIKDIRRLIGTPKGRKAPLGSYGKKITRDISKPVIAEEEIKEKLPNQKLLKESNNTRNVEDSKLKVNNKNKSDDDMMELMKELGGR